MRNALPPLIAAGTATLFLISVVFNLRASSIAPMPPSIAMPGTPHRISITEYSSPLGKLHFRPHRLFLIRNPTPIALLTSDLQALHRLDAGNTWHCPLILHAERFDLLRLSFASGARMRIKVWTVCPPVAMMGGVTYGNFSGKPWLRLMRDINGLLHAR